MSRSDYEVVIGLEVHAELSTGLILPTHNLSCEKTM